MDSLSSPKQNHFAMFPWFAYGHMIPFLHLSNKLAERGHRISFLLPKGAQPTLEKLSLHQDLIHFFPIHVPHLEGLPPGAETASDVSLSSHHLIFIAMDKTRDQVETILTALKPDLVFFDYAYWLPSLACHLGIKFVYYAVSSAAAHAILLAPSRKIYKDWTLKPSGYLPLPAMVPTHEAKKSVSGERLLSFLERQMTSVKDCDALAMRTCPEVEGSFCHCIAQQYEKPVLLSGSLLSSSETKAAAPPLEDRWAKWLSSFKPKSVVFCTLGTMIVLEKTQFQEMLLGFELANWPFLVVLKPPQGCETVEEALPQGFLERVEGRGMVYGGWVPQQAILKHPSIGCSVNHGGYGTMWESLVNDSQIVLIPYIGEHIINTRLMVEELEVAVEVKRAENAWVTQENLSNAIKSVMDDSEFATQLRMNRAKWKDIVLSHEKQGGYFDSFIQNLQTLLEEKTWPESNNGVESNPQTLSMVN